MAPAEDNPYSAHPMPLQIAQQMDQQGRVRGASLAYEAAARVSAALLILHYFSKHKLHLVNFSNSCWHINSS